MSLILDFVTMLRYFGLPISPDETITAQKTYQILGVEKKDSLEIGLRAAIVKRYEDIHIFDECFKTFFNYHPASNLIKSSLSIEDPDGVERFLNRLKSNINDLEHKIGKFLVQKQIEKAVKMTQEALMQSSGISSGQMLFKELEELNKSLQRSFRLAFRIPLPIRGLTLTQRQELSTTSLKLAAILNMFEQRIKREVISELENNLELKEQISPENISGTEAFIFQELSQVSLTIANVKEQLIEIGKILASRERQRRKRAKKGKLDFRRTFRKNLMNNGIPIDLVQKRKRIRDTEIIILNDVSGSTRWVADWFFVITYAAQEVFRKIRIFEFDNTMVEITDALSRKTINRALEERSKCWEKPLRKRRIHSDYQTSLEDFFYLIKYRPLTRRTSVLILGDCRDNEGMWTSSNPISADLIRKITTTAKRVLVLNPEDKSIWDTGDSVVNFFKLAGAEIFHVENLKNLISLVFAL